MTDTQCWHYTHRQEQHLKCCPLTSLIPDAGLQKKKNLLNSCPLSGLTCCQRMHWEYIRIWKAVCRCDSSSVTAVTDRQILHRDWNISINYISNSCLLQLLMHIFLNQDVRIQQLQWRVKQNSFWICTATFNFLAARWNITLLSLGTCFFTQSHGSYAFSGLSWSSLYSAFHALPPESLFSRLKTSKCERLIPVPFSTLKMGLSIICLVKKACLFPGRH